jgi:hypothetical protein
LLVGWSLGGLLLLSLGHSSALLRRIRWRLPMSTLESTR